jgi:outer membrane protein assembly factor BamB
MRVTLLSWLIVGSTSFAADWPQWRGPQHDGISTESIAADAQVTQVWKAKVGIGFSGIAVAANRAFTLGHDGDETESVFAFDATTGKPLWNHDYKAELGDRYFEGGPLSTPTVDGDHVFTLSKWGDLFCFDAAIGKVLWTKNIATEAKVEPPEWGFSGSVLVAGDHLYLNVGSRGTKLTKADGKIVWTSDADPATGYSTPQLVKVNGKEQLLIANSQAYIAAAPATGAAVWSIDWPTRYEWHHAVHQQWLWQGLCGL